MYGDPEKQRGHLYARDALWTHERGRAEPHALTRASLRITLVLQWEKPLNGHLPTFFRLPL